MISEAMYIRRPLGSRSVCQGNAERRTSRGRLDGLTERDYIVVAAIYHHN
jgi:hypothetical protein